MEYSGYHVLQWHITHRCNLRCGHCYQEEYMALSSKEELFSVLSAYEAFLKAHSMKGHINITGGEPLSHPEFFTLAEEIRRRGISFAVLTNGTLLNVAMARRLARLRSEYVQVSIDGTRAVHDAIRAPGSYDRAFHGIDLLKAAGMQVTVSFTVQRNNRFCFLPVAVECRRHNVDKLWFDRVVIPAAEDADRLSLSTAQYRAFLKKAGLLNRIFMRENGTSTVECCRALQFLECPSSCGYICAPVAKHLTVLANGDLMPCRRLPFIEGNVLETSIDAIIAGSEIIQQLLSAPLPEKCSSCPHTGKCNGGAKCVTYAQTGKLLSKDVNCYV